MDLLLYHLKSPVDNHAYIHSILREAQKKADTHSLNPCYRALPIPILCNSGAIKGFVMVRNGEGEKCLWFSSDIYNLVRIIRIKTLHSMWVYSTCVEKSVQSIEPGEGYVHP